MQDLFSRAWQQKYLTPAERAAYKFVSVILVIVPTGAILAGIDTYIPAVRDHVPPLLWQVLIALLSAGLLAFAKYASAQGDTAVGAVLQQMDAEIVQDASSRITSLGTNAATPGGKPIIMPPPNDGPKG